MASRFIKMLAILILLNNLFFTAFSANTVPASPPKSSIISATTKKCPEDTLKFGVCGSWLGLITENIGTKPSKECCSLVSGLADLEAALCLCTALKPNVLGLIKLEVPVALSLLVNACGKKVPDGFVCA